MLFKIGVILKISQFLQEKSALETRFSKVIGLVEM